MGPINCAPNPVVNEINMRVQLFSETRTLTFGPSLNHLPYFVYVSNEASGEIAWIMAPACLSLRGCYKISQRSRENFPVNAMIKQRQYTVLCCALQPT